MPSLSDNPKLVSTATCRNFFKSSAFPSLGLSNIPVRDTPNNLSSSVLFCQILRNYLKFVKVDWNVPSIVASDTLLSRLFMLSVSLTTTSVRLQN